MFLMTEAALRIDPFGLSWWGGVVVVAKEDTPPMRFHVFETDIYEASLWMCKIMSEAWYLMVASGCVAI
jgi:hypothetical protein